MPALQVRLNDEEYARCKDVAKVAGLSMSEWVRGRLFDGEQPSPVPDPSFKPRPLPPRVPVNAEGVIAAPARKVPLPPSKRRKKDSAPPLITAPAAEIPEIPEFEELKEEVPIDAQQLAGFVEETVASLQKFQADNPGVRLLPPTGPREDGPFVEAPLVESTYPFTGIPRIVPAHVASKPSKQFKRAVKCTSRKCENLQTATCDACRCANAVAVDDMEIEQTSSGEPRHNFKRHPKCDTEKCERFGNCCSLCKLANAVGF